jgi:hypothetical protein
VGSAAPKIQDTVFLFKNIFPRRSNGGRLRVRARAGRPNGDRRRHARVHEHDRLTAELRDKLLGEMHLMVYTPAVNKAVWADLQRFDLNPELRSSASRRS